MIKTLAELRDKQVLTFADIFKGILSISIRIPYLMVAFRKVFTLKQDARESWGRLLELNAEKYPNRPALKWNDSCMTYEELNKKTNRYAHYLMSKGLKKGDVVTVILENRPELFMVYCAVAKIGAISCMVNTNLRQQPLLHCLNQVRGKMFIIGEEVIGQFFEVKTQVKNTNNHNLYSVSDQGGLSVPKGFIDINEKIKEMPDNNPCSVKDIRLKDPVAYVFTSGTTGGMPKAAVIIHRRLISSLIWYGKILQRTKPTDTIYCPLPFFHTNGLVVGWPAAMAKGAALAVRRKFSVTRFWEDVRKFKATCFIYVGEFPRYLLNQKENRDDRKHSLKKIIGNGLRPELWNEFKQRFGIKKIYELYGAAESMGGFRNLLNLDQTVGLSLQSHAFVRCDLDRGVPLRNTEGFMERVGTGESGLLIFKLTDKNRFIGYTDKMANEEKILRDVFEKEDSWFNSGDLMRDMGYLHAQFVDRLGDSFRWKSENVSTTEVEKVVNGFSGIELAAVYGVKIPDCDGRGGMAAIVTRERVSDLDFRALADHLKENLPSYAVPLFLRFKHRLDFTATEKVRKKNLKEEGFDLDGIKDPIYVLLPGGSEYELLKRDIYKNIQNGEIRF